MVLIVWSITKEEERIPNPSSPTTQIKINSEETIQSYGYWNRGGGNGVGESVQGRVVSRIVKKTIYVTNPSSVLGSFVHILFIGCFCWRQCNLTWRQQRKWN